MSAATALRPMWFAGITDCKGARKVTTDSFLVTKTVHLISAARSGEFTLYVSNKKKLSEFFCHEADRFSSAAFESLAAETVRPTFPRSIGWQLIRGYYAAFFALHSLMRLHGWACTRLNASICTRFENDRKLYFTESDQINAGMYLIKVVGTSTELTFSNLGANGGGSHEALWDGLFEFLTEMTNVTLTNPVDQYATSQQLVDSVTAFKALLQKNGGPRWLTRVRNKVNYAHEFGVWHPYNASTCDSVRVAEVLGRWKVEPSNIILKATSDEVLQFCEACAFLVSLCRATVKDLAFRSAANSPIKLTNVRLLG